MGSNTSSCTTSVKSIVNNKSLVVTIKALFYKDDTFQKHAVEFILQQDINKMYQSGIQCTFIKQNIVDILPYNFLCPDVTNITQLIAVSESEQFSNKSNHDNGQIDNLIPMKFDVGEIIIKNILRDGKKIESNEKIKIHRIFRLLRYDCGGIIDSNFNCDSKSKSNYRHSNSSHTHNVHMYPPQTIKNGELILTVRGDTTKKHKITLLQKKWTIVIFPVTMTTDYFVPIKNGNKWCRYVFIGTATLCEIYYGYYGKIELRKNCMIMCN
jgi:hypothetical protein